MSILWCGGEEIDFPNGAAVTIYTSSGYRTSYSRGALHAGGSIGRSKTFSSITSGWLSAQATRSASSTSIITFGLSKDLENAGVFVGIGTVIGKVALYKRVSGTNTRLAEESGTSYSTSGAYKTDMELISFGGTCTINVYVAGAQVITWTGDLSGVVTGDSLNTVCVVGAPANSSYVSELILADEDTRLMSLVTLAPNASGDASAWTNGYTNIDEVTLSDADVIYSSTADQEFQCNLTGMPTGDFICKGVKVVARATDGVGGVGIQMGVKTNSTVDLGSTITLGGSWETVERIYQQNPITSNRFTPAEIDALQFAVKSVAT